MWSIWHVFCFCFFVYSAQWTADKATDVFLQLACGVKHLHACGVLHRDLKTDNALVQASDPLVVKWADFGCSVLLAAVDAESTYGDSGTCSVASRPAISLSCFSMSMHARPCGACREPRVHGLESADRVARPRDVRESCSGQGGHRCVDRVGRVHAGVLLPGARHEVHPHTVRLADRRGFAGVSEAGGHSLRRTH